MKLHVSDDLVLAADFVTATAGIFATKGMGKSCLAQVIAVEMRDRGYARTRRVSAQRFHSRDRAAISGGRLNAKTSHARSRRDGRMVAFQTIGCALATLGRLDHVWYDNDLCRRITQAWRTLAVTQSALKDKIDAANDSMPAAERMAR